VAKLTALALLAVALLVGGCGVEGKHTARKAPPAGNGPAGLPAGAFLMPESQPDLKVLKEVSAATGDRSVGLVAIPPGKDFWVDFNCAGAGKATVYYQGTAGRFEHTCGGVPMRNRFGIEHPAQMPFRVDVPDNAKWSLRVQQ
jgi:hypothetical protein